MCSLTRYSFSQESHHKKLLNGGQVQFRCKNRLISFVLTMVSSSTSEEPLLMLEHHDRLSMHIQNLARQWDFQLSHRESSAGGCGVAPRQYIRAGVGLRQYIRAGVGLGVGRGGGGGVMKMEAAFPAALPPCRSPPRPGGRNRRAREGGPDRRGSGCRGGGESRPP